MRCNLAISIVAFALLTLSLLLSSQLTLAATELVYVGTVDKYPIAMTIAEDGEPGVRVEGHYLYLRHGQPIKLTGHIDMPKLKLKEWQGKAATAQFELAVGKNSVKGHWAELASKRKLDVTLEPKTWARARCAASPLQAKVRKVELERGAKFRRSANEGKVALNLPDVHGNSPGIKAMRAAFDFNQLFELEQTLVEAETAGLADSWLQRIETNISRSDPCFLSIAVRVEGLAAYSDGYLRTFNYDPLTAKPMTLTDLVDFKLHETLAVRVQQLFLAELNANIAAQEAQEPGFRGDLEMPSAAQRRWTLKDLNQFLVTEQGIEFHYDFGFPKVLSVLEPMSQLLTWDELRPFLVDDRLLSKR